MTIDLYQLQGSPPCRVVLLVAKYLGIKLNVKALDWIKQDHMKPEFLKMNPLHCVPTIDDNGFYLWESRAIITYFVNKYSPDSDLYPKDPKKRAVIDRLLYFDIGTLYKALTDAMYFPVFHGKDRNPDKETELKNALQILEDSLAKNPYVAGDDLSLADISISITVKTIRLMTVAVEIDLSSFCNVERWEKRIIERVPFFKEVNDEGEKHMRDFVLSLVKK